MVLTELGVAVTADRIVTIDSRSGFQISVMLDHGRLRGGLVIPVPPVMNLHCQLRCERQATDLADVWRDLLVNTVHVTFHVSVTAWREVEIAFGTFRLFLVVVKNDVITCQRQSRKVKCNWKIGEQNQTDSEMNKLDHLFSWMKVS